MAEKSAPPKPFYKKPIFIIIVAVLVILYFLKASGALKLNFEVTRNAPQPTASYEPPVQPQEDTKVESPTLAPEAETSKGYQNFRNGFKLNYPSNWQLKENPANAVIVGFYSPKESSSDKFVENANITVNDLSSNPPEDVEELANLWWKDAQSGFPAGSISLVSNEEDVISDLDARTVTYKIQSKGLDLKGQATMTIKNDKAYILTFTGEENTYDKYMDDVDLMLDTFIIN